LPNEDLIELYQEIERLRLDILRRIKAAPFVREPLPDLPGAYAYIKNNAIHIIVNECLPRVCDIRNSSHIRDHWVSMISCGLTKAKINKSFKHALCIIKIYAPIESIWDVDNRAYGIIIDAIRYNRIIKDDSWNNLSFMVTGQKDTERPRVEIIIQELGNNHLETIDQMSKFTRK
jgi:hypothetical protein